MPDNAPSSSSRVELIDPSIKQTSPSEPYYNLGTFSRRITTTSEDAQAWFDRGLIWSYGFNHLEAVRCFEQAILADPEAAMAYWGYAYAKGPNYNKPWELFDAEDMDDSLRKCHYASVRAAALAQTDIERGLCEAIGHRFPKENDGKYAEWTRKYGDAMKKVYDRFGDDLDIATLYADSRMNLAPWELWDLKTGEPRADSNTKEIQTVIEKGLSQPAAMKHPGLLHLYIHLMEMSPSPESAIPASDRLRGLVPDAGHLNHMPSHLDLLIGDYRRAIASNLEGIIGDEKYREKNGAADYYAFYRLHNYHILIYAAMFNGQFKIAMETLDRMEHSLGDDVMRVGSPPLVDWLETFKTVRLHVLVRFGKWDEILALPFPDDMLFYIVTTTSLHYARALAYALKDDIPAAENEREAFRTHLAKVPDTRLEYPNKMTDILRIAEAMLDGELEYRKGNFDSAFSHLETSIQRSDNLIYSEPWGWMQPPRHAYAALKLERGEVEVAARVYAADLGFDDTLPRAHQHPNNVWALHGFHECLVKLGREAEARIVSGQLKLALAVADISVESSCFCRRVVPVSNETVCCA